MPELTLDINSAAFVQKVFVEGPDVVAKQLRVGMRDAGRDFERFLKQKHRGSWRSPAPDRLRVRSGDFRRSLGVAVLGQKLEELRMHVGYGPPATPAFIGNAGIYGPFHARGGTIRPKTRQFLAIPTEENLGPDGIAIIRSPLDIPNAVFIPWQFKSGRGFLVIDPDRDEILFQLHREVFIPKRLFLAEDWLERVNITLRHLVEALGIAVKVINGGGR